MSYFQSEGHKKSIVCMSVQMQVCLAQIVLHGAILFILKQQGKTNVCIMTMTFIWEEGQTKSM